MKKIMSILSIVFSIMVVACSSNNLYEDLPKEIQDFVAQYYPGASLDSFTSSSNSYTVIVKDGPTITFDSTYHWTKIDGNGSVLPQVLIFNDFPPELYEYLQETDNTNNVFEVMRNSAHYDVKLLTSSILYEINTGKITSIDDEM